MRQRARFFGWLVMALVLASCADDGATEHGASHDHGAYEQDELAAWDQAAQDRTSGKADEAGCSGVIVPDRSGFQKRIALTFDDGPDAVMTPQVVETLARYDAKATFFINDAQPAGTEDTVVRQLLEAGHLVGNHGTNHRNMIQLPSARVESEVDGVHDRLVASGITPTWFRFPFGSSNCETAGIVRSYGYRIVGWHIDSADWCFASARGGVGHCDATTFKWVPDAYRDDMVGWTLKQARDRNGGILLFHDVHRYTVDTLDEILRALVDDGFTFVNIDDVSAFPALNEHDDSEGFPWVGDVCSTDDQCAFASGASCLTYEGGADGFCTVGCEGYCDDLPGRAPTFCTSTDGVSGTCVSKAHEINDDCASIPGAARYEAQRFVGSSPAPAASAVVCLPDGV